MHVMSIGDINQSIWRIYGVGNCLDTRRTKNTGVGSRAHGVIIAAKDRVNDEERNEVIYYMNVVKCHKFRCRRFCNLNYSDVVKDKLKSEKVMN